jgi:outer membrane protein assembly factor BamB
MKTYPLGSDERESKTRNATNKRKQPMKKQTTTSNLLIGALERLFRATFIAGILPVFLLSAASTASAGSANTAVLTLSVSVGPPTTKTRVSGTGYTPGEIVCVGFDQTRVGSVRTDTTGSFSRTFRVPASALPGRHSIRGNGRTGGDYAEADFLVRTDWPQYHFDHAHTGFNRFENVLSPSNVSGLQVAWSFPGPCTSYSGPVAVDGTVYVGNYCNTLYALDEGTGAMKWSAATGGKVDATPAVVGEIVYVGAGDGKVYAFNKDTGTRLWSYATGSVIYSSPAVRNGIVFIGSTNSNLYALDGSTGALLWSVLTGGAVNSTPVVAGGVVYVGSADGSLYAIDEHTGGILWTGPTGGEVSSPAVRRNEVFVGSSAGLLYVFDARGCGSATCSPLWVGDPGVGTGSSPAIAYGRVFIGGADGNLYAFNADGCGASTCAEVWSAATGGSIGGGPAIANLVVYTGSSFENAIYAFDADTGALLWSYSGGSTGYGGDTDPSVADGMLFATLTWSFQVYAFRLP